MRLVNIAVGFATLLSAPVWALQADRQQPVYIEADRADMDDQKGISIYRGNVSLTQGTMVLKCEILTAYHTPESRALHKVVIEGSPARFRQIPAQDKEEVIATAPKMEYLVDKQMVYLLDKAEVTQGRNIFRGKKIEYNINDNQVHAESGNTPSERVRVTLFPQEKAKPTTPVQKTPDLTP